VKASLAMDAAQILRRSRVRNIAAATLQIDGCRSARGGRAARIAPRLPRQHLPHMVDRRTSSLE